MTTRLADRSVSPSDEAPANPAETYERYMVPALFAPAAVRLIEAAQPRPGERVLDVGTGTGIVARHVAPLLGPSGTVTGLDPSPGMLAIARTMAAEEGVMIDWHEGRAEAIPFPDGSFDLVLSQFALMFFADREAALREMWRVLAPGGRLAISVFQGIDRHPFYQALDRAIARRLDASPVAEIFALSDAAALQALLARTGFSDVVIEPFALTARFPQPDAFLAGEIDVDTAAIPAMQNLDPAARRALTAALEDEMAEPLREVTSGDEVHMPFHAQIARATR